MSFTCSCGMPIFAGSILLSLAQDFMCDTHSSQADILVSSTSQQNGFCVWVRRHCLRQVSHQEVHTHDSCRSYRLWLLGTEPDTEFSRDRGRLHGRML